jgi:hypothetical protein
MGLELKAKMTRKYCQAQEGKAMTIKNIMLKIEDLSLLLPLRLSKDQLPRTYSIPQQILTGWVVFHQQQSLKSVTKHLVVSPRLPCLPTHRSPM